MDRGVVNLLIDIENSIKAERITKCPNPAALQKEYEDLQAQKEALYADYGKLKRKVREYDVIKQNIWK